MPRTLSIHGLRELLDEQLAVASRGQLLALGMNDRAMQYRLRPDGPWQALLPGIYLAVTGTPTFEQKEMAALLYAGDRKSTRLNSSHVEISYAVFCLKKKTKKLIAA